MVWPHQWGIMAEIPALPERRCDLLSCGEFCCSCVRHRGDFHPMCVDASSVTCTECVWSTCWQPLFGHQLGDESRGLSEFCIQHRPKTWLKCNQEFAIPIWDNGLWDPKVYPHSLKEELNSGLYCDTLLAGCHDGHLRESIDDNENAIVAVLSRRKARNIIDGDRLPRPTRSR